MLSIHTIGVEGATVDNHKAKVENTRAATIFLFNIGNRIFDYTIMGLHYNVFLI
jgi:hypothetical protein